MTELLCARGHVLDPGRDTCSRCNGAAVNAPVVEAPQEEKPKRVRTPKVEKPVEEKKPKAEKVAKTVKPKGKSKGKGKK